MYVITAVLAFGLAVAIERAFLFWIRWRVDSAVMLSQVAQGGFEAAKASAGAHPVGRIVGAAVGQTSAEAAWDAMGSEAALVEADIRQRVPYLAMVGNVATMLGLLGTVYGLILAFSGLTDASAAERTVRLSEGIATAMSTTAWGLVVGIPALAMHALLDSKAARILALCEAAASKAASACRS
jgi:biopolymer transport protein ExbB/TolQ